MESRQLFREGRQVHLSPKAFELLKLLVENRPRALAKTELIERVWPETFVSDASLARVIVEIRDAVGDDARDATLVRTVHRFGYAFAAPTTELREATQTNIVPTTRCWLIWGSREVRLGEGENWIGRDSEAAVQLDSPKVSRNHARIFVSGSDATIEDAGSKNGTFVNDEKLTASVSLQPGDEITIGPFRLTFRVTGGTGTTETDMA